MVKIKLKAKTPILDNKSQENAVFELKENISAVCTLSMDSALFSLYACDKLKKELSKVSKFKLLVPCHICIIGLCPPHFPKG